MGVPYRDLRLHSADALVYDLRATGVEVESNGVGSRRAPTGKAHDHGNHPIESLDSIGLLRRIPRIGVLDGGT